MTCTTNVRRAGDLRRTSLAPCHFPTFSPCICDRRSVFPAVLQFALFTPQSFALACQCFTFPPFPIPSNLSPSTSPYPPFLLTFILIGVFFFQAQGKSVHDLRTRLLVVMARAKEQPGPAHWPCGLSHSPLLLVLASAPSAPCRRVLVLAYLFTVAAAACLPSCVKALHRGISCRLP